MHIVLCLLLGTFPHQISAGKCACTGVQLGWRCLPGCCRVVQGYSGNPGALSYCPSSIWAPNAVVPTCCWGWQQPGNSLERAQVPGHVTKGLAGALSQYELLIELVNLRFAGWTTCWSSRAAACCFPYMAAVLLCAVFVCCPPRGLAAEPLLPASPVMNLTEKHTTYAQVPAAGELIAPLMGLLR